MTNHLIPSNIKSSSKQTGGQTPESESKMGILIKVTKLQNSASKQDEMDWLDAVARAVGDRTYLKDLLTPELIAWASQKMREDWSLDLLSEYQNEIDGRLDAERAQKKQAMAFERDRERLERQHEVQVAKLEKRVQDLENALDNAIRNKDRWLGAYKKANLSSAEEYDKNCRLAKDNKRLEQEVKDLKARLYDQMVLKPEDLE